MPPAGCSLRSAQFYALWWASEQSGTYFRAQNGRSHLTFNRIANFNAKIELGVLTMMERPAAEVALRPADRRYAGRRATAAHLLMVGGSNAASPMSFVAMLGVTATSVRPSDIGHFVAI
jgi:hypothetical protein